jgi:type I restriction enzyme R subunit
MPNIISEDNIEKEIIKLLEHKYQYRSINCYTQDAEDLEDRSGRKDKRETVFRDILKERLTAINTGIPESAIEQGIENLLSPRYGLSPLEANKEIYQYIKMGIPVEYQDSEGKVIRDKITIVDFKNPGKNDFCAVTQLWIKGDRYFRRPDILIYINGIPLVFIELKNSIIKLKNAYEENLINYRTEIGQLFNYNAFCVFSNAIETRVGSFNSDYEHFFVWLRPDDETEKIQRKTVEQDGTSIERLIDGLFSKERLLDYIENFILYYDNDKKIIAQNHQFLGVNNAIKSFENRQNKDGKLGVFWHTQGSGKSFSMIFLVRKIFHNYTGDFTFLVITDREDLDGQIYRNFLNTETVRKEEAAQPKNSEEMRDFLKRDLRIVFTLIHKFRYEKGKDYPILSERNNIIVMVDEAHRTQYASLAENMRKGLPNAQFFAFTGTPLLGKERKTNKWFGEYVSEYYNTQSIDDGNTVPLFYQKRVPEVLIQNENLSDEFYQLLEDENFDEKAKEKIEKEYAKEIEVIKRDDRLNTIAKDIAFHFPRRGYLGKGMVISVDRFTSIKMYDKVQNYWKEEIKRLIGFVNKSKNEYEKKKNLQILEYMRNVEMAVIISEENGEEEYFEKQGLDIKPHRKKINMIDENGHDIEYRFKDPKDKLQLVFICAMWMTGFDVPTVSTLYLDKPMKDHTLMQAIARANRVTSFEINGVTKINGEIVDYYNVFRNIKKALADYSFGEKDNEEVPIQDKSKLFNLLDEVLIQGENYLQSIGIFPNRVYEDSNTFKNISLFNSFANTILEKDIFWKEFKVYENTISSLYEACKPEILQTHTRPLILVFQYLRGVIETIIGQSDIDSIKLKISELLDQSVVTANPEEFSEFFKPDFTLIKKGKVLDLSKLDCAKLKEEFGQKEYKNIEITNLREFIQKKLEQMIRVNSTRINFANKFQQIVEKYNSGGMLTEDYFTELVKFTEELKEEEERNIREELTEDELEIYDILKKEKMTKEEEIQVKNAAKKLLHRLKDEKPKVLIQDWYRDKQSQIKVKTAIDEVLDKELPETYKKEIFKDKSYQLYNLIINYSLQGYKFII